MPMFHVKHGGATRRKLIQRPQTWLVSVSKEKQARWLILSDFPLVSVDRFSQLLNKLLGRRDVPRETTPTFRSHQTYVSRETLKSFQESTKPNGKPLAIQHSPIRTQHTHLLKQTVWILKIYGIRSSIFYKHDHRREGFHYRHYLCSTWNTNHPQTRQDHSSNH